VDVEMVDDRARPVPVLGAHPGDSSAPRTMPRS